MNTVGFARRLMRKNMHPNYFYIPVKSDGDNRPWYSISVTLYCPIYLYYSDPEKNSYYDPKDGTSVYRYPVSYSIYDENFKRKTGKVHPGTYWLIIEPSAKIADDDRLTKKIKIEVTDKNVKIKMMFTPAISTFTVYKSGRKLGAEEIVIGLFASKDGTTNWAAEDGNPNMLVSHPYDLEYGTDIKSKYSDALYFTSGKFGLQTFEGPYKVTAQSDYKVQFYGYSAPNNMARFTRSSNNNPAKYCDWADDEGNVTFYKYFSYWINMQTEYDELCWDVEGVNVEGTSVKNRVEGHTFTKQYTWNTLGWHNGLWFTKAWLKTFYTNPKAQEGNAPLLCYRAFDGWGVTSEESITDMQTFNITTSIYSVRSQQIGHTLDNASLSPSDNISNGRSRNINAMVDCLNDPRANFPVLTDYSGLITQNPFTIYGNLENGKIVTDSDEAVDWMSGYQWFPYTSGGVYNVLLDRDEIYRDSNKVIYKGIGWNKKYCRTRTEDERMKILESSDFYTPTPEEISYTD